MYFQSQMETTVFIILQIFFATRGVLKIVLFLVFMDRDGVEVPKLAKKERGQYPAMLTEKAFGEIFLAGHSG